VGSSKKVSQYARYAKCQCVGDVLAETGIQKWGSGAVAAIDEDDATNYVLIFLHNFCVARFCHDWLIL